MLYMISCITMRSGPYNKPGINFGVSVSLYILTPDTVAESSRHSKMQSGLSRRVSGCCDGREWDALKDHPWSQQEWWRKIPEGRQRDRCRITSLHNA